VGDEAFDPSFPYGAISFAVLPGVPDYVLVASDHGGLTWPLGPAGPQLSVSAGFGLLHRTCVSGQTSHFDPVALDTVVRLSEQALQLETSLSDDSDSFASLCGQADGAAVDLGDVVAALPDSSTRTAPRITASLVWSWEGDAVFAVTGTLSDGHTVSRLRVADRSTQVIAQSGSSDDRFPGLSSGVAGGGFVLATYARLDASSGNTGYRFFSKRVTAQRLIRLGVPTGGGAMLGLPMDPGVLSPDGRTLATTVIRGPALTTHTQVLDVPTAAVLADDLSEGYPVAWSPDGGAILVWYPSSSGFDSRFLLLPWMSPQRPNSVVYSRWNCDAFSDRDENARCFWTASGPQIFFQDEGGARVLNLITQKTTELVPPSRVAPPLASAAVVVATDQLFAWSLACAGLGETSCSAELRRLTIGTGQIDTVAHARAALPFAVTNDGTRIAFTDGEGLYIKTIAP
jgi:hypothetical protein